MGSRDSKQFPAFGVVAEVAEVADFDIVEDVGMGNAETGGILDQRRKVHKLQDHEYQEWEELLELVQGNPGMDLLVHDP